MKKNKGSLSKGWLPGIILFLNHHLNNKLPLNAEFKLGSKKRKHFYNRTLVRSFKNTYTVRSTLRYICNVIHLSPVAGMVKWLVQDSSDKLRSFMIGHYCIHHYDSTASTAIIVVKRESFLLLHIWDINTTLKYKKD